MTADAKQVGGSHYVDKKVQPWDAMEAWMTPQEFVGFLRGNVIKYLARCNDKGGVEDLKKARHYLDKLIEFHSQNVAGSSVNKAPPAIVVGGDYRGPWLGADNGSG